MQLPQNASTPRSAMNRRRFLAAGTALSTAAFSSTLARAIEPFQRIGDSHFKFSLAAYSYRTLLQAKGKEPELTLVDFIRDCAKLGLDGTELTSYYFPEEVTPQYLRMLKGECFRLGLDVSGTAVRNDFGYGKGDPERQRWIDHVKQWVDYAEQLSAPVIRIFAGHEKKGVAPAETHRLMVAGMQECCDYAGQHGVHLALENHGGPTASADGLLKLVKAVDSPWFGVNLDTGNFRSDRPYEEIAEAAPYAINVQVKAAIANENREKQPADYERIAKILRDANYSGYIVLEYEEAGDPRIEAPKEMAKMRRAFEANA